MGLWTTLRALSRGAPGRGVPVAPTVDRQPAVRRQTFAQRLREVPEEVLASALSALGQPRSLGQQPWSLL